MRRWFVLVLAFMLAAQFSWAAAASYCSHETRSNSASHFGHHAHSHAHDGAAEKPGAKRVMQAADVEHGHCHLIQVVLPSPGAVAHSSAEQLAAAPAPAVRPKSFIPAGLDRPNWWRA